VDAVTGVVVAALRKGPATLSGLRNRVAREARRRLSSAEVLRAVRTGAVRFDPRTRRYEVAP
jgi:hypothetical protein